MLSRKYIEEQLEYKHNNMRTTWRAKNHDPTPPPVTQPQHQTAPMAQTPKVTYTTTPSRSSSGGSLSRLMAGSVTGTKPVPKPFQIRYAAHVE